MKYHLKNIYIYGASGHGMVVADLARACGYEKIIFIDDGDNEFLFFETIMYDNTIPLAFGIGDNKTRAMIFEKVVSCGFQIVSLVHPSAVVSHSVTVGVGTVVMPNVVVNAKACIGKGVILNSGCIVEHDCDIHDFVHISPNAALAGCVEVGARTHVGIGSNVLQGIKVGENSIIGAGSVVIQNIENSVRMAGVPAKKISDVV